MSERKEQKRDCNMSDASEKKWMDECKAIKEIYFLLACKVAAMKSGN